MEKEKLDKILSNFLISDTYTRGSSYIFPDGRFLNLLENISVLEKQIKSYDVYTHTALDTWVNEYEYVDSYVEDCLLHLCNCVKINDGSNFTFQQAHMAIPENELTSQQYKVLEDWFYHTMTVEGNKRVEIQGQTFTKVFTFNDPVKDDGYFPEEIIKWIKNYYKGKREELN